jgi:hypothetical protein
MATASGVKLKRRTVQAAKPRSHARRARARRLTLLVATRKGAFIYYSDAARKGWRVDGPHFLGHIINHLVIDPRDGRSMLMAAKTGHLGPTIFRSSDFGKSWKEATRPPAFPKAAEGEPQRAVDYTFWLTPGHPDEPRSWYGGTSPRALFRTDDGGETWESIAGFNDHPMLPKWAPPEEETPGGNTLHSILIDPRDASHLYLGMSGGGVFESLDKGVTWQALNKGVVVDFGPDLYPEYGQDPHCVCMHPMRPDRLYQQNHCGIYRLDRPGDTWDRIGNRMPKEVGDIGFGIVLHPRDPDTCWVFPMDGTTVWPRTSPGGRPATYRTRDGGASWERQDRGLPREQGWFTVKRQAFAADPFDPVGLYFGTTGGEIWLSANEGGSWRQLAAHLPEIFALETAVIAA